MTIVTPDRNLGTGHSRQGEPPGTGDRRKGPAGGGTSPDAEVGRHASTGGRGASSEIPGSAGSWGREAPDGAECQRSRNWGHCQIGLFAGPASPLGGVETGQVGSSGQRQFGSSAVRHFDGAGEGRGRLAAGGVLLSRLCASWYSPSRPRTGTARRGAAGATPRTCGGGSCPSPSRCAWPVEGDLRYAT